MFSKTTTKPAPENKDDVVLNKNQARQGLELHAMRYVLGISFGMAVLALFLTYILSF